MANLHHKVLALIEAGPQRVSTCPMCKGSGKRVSHGFTGKEATHGCHTCNATGRLVETPEEFALRIALRAVELEREECAKVCERVYLDASPHASIHVMQTAILAIRRRGKP